MKKIAKIFLDIGIYAAIAVGLVWGLPRGLSRALGTPYPMATITSGSMWPVLKEGDLILIQAVPKQALKVGDIVVWRNPQGFTVHRVVKLGDETFVTKGDANFKDDAPVRYEDLIGRTVAIREQPLRIPYVGFISLTASKYGK
ncbi:MAG: signal peptidase I [Candidatus Sungbacteria bacterium]|uniref:Signal peptidase I n=1 Tax=Candidatus Sungiibacteriota bacterium TaxID=2750080 RepID=A0A932YWF3_9BACT|nr:signal peptidase I [Candidatus Sungbacteria bacterium]